MPGSSRLAALSAAGPQQVPFCLACMWFGVCVLVGICDLPVATAGLAAARQHPHNVLLHGPGGGLYGAIYQCSQSTTIMHGHGMRVMPLLQCCMCPGFLTVCCGWSTCSLGGCGHCKAAWTLCGIVTNCTTHKRVLQGSARFYLCSKVVLATCALHISPVSISSHQLMPLLSRFGRHTSLCHC